MKDVLLQNAKELNKQHIQKKWWHNAVSVMVAIVVFCTTYALILPAITMEKETVCGLEEHIHTESCYQQPVPEMVCQTGLTGCIIHSHDAACFDDQGQLLCSLAELTEHTHGEGCYTTQTTLVCQIAEAEPHIHGDGCYEAQMVPCDTPEAEGHVHTDACYAVQLTEGCGLAEAEAHTHGEGCYTTTQTQLCQLAEDETHTHGAECFASETVLTCTLTETEGHTHSESCMVEQASLICDLAETEGHTHSVSCMALQNVLICTLPETEGHTHGEGCHQTETILSCGLTAVAVHSHSESCYDDQGTLVCQITEATAHQHTEACWAVPQVEEPVLICQIPVHSHEDACYLVEETTAPVSPYLCGLGEHTHGETCQDAEGNLICTIPEHFHEAACLVADLDPTADVELPHQWEATVQNVMLTGNWPKDVLAIAQTQLGYRESEKNVVLDGDMLKGYTRYGDWYGMPYGDWCAMFLSFCLDHANVTDFPLNASCSNWIEALTGIGAYQESGSYIPNPGDLIFFTDGTALSSHVGLVAELVPETEDAPAQVVTIEGNSANTVQYNTYVLTDETIVGYGQLPVGPTIILTYQGADFTVTATFNENAGIPKNAELTVREIEAGSEEYETYFRQSIEILLTQGSAEIEEELGVTSARFFDISFLVDGQTVEPTDAVDIQIRYNDSIAMNEAEKSIAVHFADEGIEVLEAAASGQTAEEEAQVDTFDFTQNSFSVTGIVVANADRATGVYTTENPNTLDSSGSTRYIVYTKVGDAAYAMNSNGDPVAITLDANGNITGNIPNTLLWTFQYESPNTYIIKNVGAERYMHSYYNSSSNWSVLTTRAYSSVLELAGEGSDLTFRVRSNSNYAYYTESTNWNSTTRDFQVTQNAANAATFYIAALPQDYYHVWFDGTNGDLMGLYGSDNTYQAVPYNSTITLPATWKSPTKYTYKLNGWYDIVSNTYYPAGAQVTITQNTVFYADWVAGTYDVGVDNEYTVNSLDTSSFITTYVFDYNSLFNVQAQAHLGSISATRHNEVWSMVTSGKVPYKNANTLDFTFVDYDSNGQFSYPNGRNDYNVNRSIITPGVLEHVSDVSGGSDLLELLFDPNVPVIGKNYVGTGNYLYQYMDSTTSNYDGHDGYYYFHSRLNAASYNQSQQRFYLYNYLERTTDSWKDGGAGEYSDFLPFNSPYANIPAGQYLQTYTPDTRQLGYQYDAKDAYTQNGTQFSKTGNVGTNYWFGIRSDIEFFLPNDSGKQDEYGNYGNISTRGQHMVFEFHGDDDVWVFVDGELMLDVGGVHGIEYGEIDFSTGVVTSGDGTEAVTRTFEEILGEGRNIKEGTHIMSVYYMERGSSQSNCSIYFNVAPRYDLEIRKQDIFTAQELNGAVFGIYNDEACTEPAQLWPSRAAYDKDMEDGKINESIHEITVENGIAGCWGVSAGKTYYIREISPPEGYPASDDRIRITLNNRGVATIETTTLHGPDGDATEGYAVIEQDVNDTLKIVALTVTNQKNMDTTEVRVEKKWAEGSTNLPEYITVYLTVDGERVGRTAHLNESNGWTYTWTGLPMYVLDETGAPATRDDGTFIEVEYRVEEVLVPNFTTDEISVNRVMADKDWFLTDRMEDSMTYLLVHNGQAMAYDHNTGAFTWMDIADAKSDLSAQWTVTTDHYGFHVSNGNNYAISFNPQTKRFYGTNDHANAINQVLYFLESQLVAQQDDVYYHFGENGTSVSSDGLVFSLYRLEVLTGFVIEIENKPIEEEAQTHVEVTKAWADAKDHSADSVTVHLYADGKDTGRTLVLSQANNWQGSFEDLPYYNADGSKIVYTVVEEPVLNYNPSYSNPIEVAARTTAVWLEANALAENQVFRFTNGSYSMASADTGAVISKANNLTDSYQQWRVLRNNNRYVLQNVGNNRYLQCSDGELNTVTSISSATTVTLTDGVLQVGSQYLRLSGKTIATSQHAYNGTSLTVTYYGTTTEMPGIGITITNVEAEYELPKTGSTGSERFTFGGLFLLAAALMYTLIPKRNRRREGRR